MSVQVAFVFLVAAQNGNIQVIHIDSVPEVEVSLGLANSHPDK